MEFLGHIGFFAPILGSAYTVAINIFEFLAVAVLISCVAFLWRRNVSKVPRFTKPEMKGWPALDGNLILVIEIVSDACDPDDERDGSDLGQ